MKIIIIIIWVKIDSRKVAALDVNVNKFYFPYAWIFHGKIKFEITLLLKM